MTPADLKGKTIKRVSSAKRKTNFDTWVQNIGHIEFTDGTIVYFNAVIPKSEDGFLIEVQELTNDKG